MKSGDKVAVAFLGIFALACGAGLFVPAVQQGTAQRGISGALNLPAWALLGFGMVLSIVLLAYIVVKHVRSTE